MLLADIRNSSVSLKWILDLLTLYAGIEAQKNSSYRTGDANAEDGETKQAVY